MNSSAYYLLIELSILVQFAGTVESTWQRFSHFECVSNLYIVIHDTSITN